MTLHKNGDDLSDLIKTTQAATSVTRDVSRRTACATETDFWMSSLQIHATLNLPTATCHPLLNCMQWSPEGQLVIVAKNAAYILVKINRFSFSCGINSFIS
jgi:hypothetical protein